jgi:hypothetical protein
VGDVDAVAGQLLLQLLHPSLQLLDLLLPPLPPVLLPQRCVDVEVFTQLAGDQPVGLVDFGLGVLVLESHLHDLLLLLVAARAFVLLPAFRLLQGGFPLLLPLFGLLIGLHGCV